MIYDKQSYIENWNREKKALNGGLLEVYVNLIPTIRKFDGKIINKRFRDALYNDVTKGIDRMYIEVKKYDYDGDKWYFDINYDPWIDGGYAKYHQWLRIEFNAPGGRLDADSLNEGINKEADKRRELLEYFEATDPAQRWDELKTEREKIAAMIKEYKKGLTMVDHDIKNYDWR